MKVLKTCLTALMICILHAVYAQRSPLKFGDISMDNLQMTTNPLDSSAGAMVILDYGNTTFDHNFKIVLEHHVRIKIFNTSELDRANVKIPYASGDRVTGLKAATYNLEDGKIVESKLSRKDIYEEEVNDEVLQKRFSLPDVKEGSIIEYTYSVNYGSWMSLSPWYFQTSIPVLHSEYIVSLPEYFNYKKISTGYVGLAAYNVSTKIGHYGSSTFNMEVQQFIAKNVPAFKEEPYMTCKDDYISKIQFELNSINIPGSINEQIMPYSYAALSKQYAEDESFGKKLINNAFLQDEIERITSGLNDKETKIASIYYYVRDSFEVDYDVKSESLRRIFNLKKGYPQDINMILISMYNEAGFKANAVKLSTRSNGKLHPVYAMASEFNHTICIVSDGEKEYLLDASKEHLPFNVLDKSCLNGRGMIVTDQNFRWVDLAPAINTQKLIYANLELSATGDLKGTIDLSRKGYNAIEFRTNYEENLEEYRKTFSENHATWTINDHEIEGVNLVEGPLKEKIAVELTGYAQAMGEMIYISPIVHGRITTNPLKRATRLFPVNYGNPFSEYITYSIQIPEGYRVEVLPETLAIRLPDNGGVFMYNVQHLGNRINLTSRFTINKVEFSAEEYQYLREFYAQVVEKQAEQIVLKRKI